MMIVSCDSITGRGRKPASRVLQRVGRRVAMRPHDGLGWPQGRRADPLRLLNKPCVLQCMTLCRSLRSRQVARGSRLGFMAPQTDKFIDKAVALVRCEPALTLCHAMPCSAPLSEFCQLRCSPLLTAVPVIGLQRARGVRDGAAAARARRPGVAAHSQACSGDA